MEKQRFTAQVEHKIRGKITRDAPLGRESWFRTGGSADLLFNPADVEDLQNLLYILSYSEEAQPPCHPERAQREKDLAASNEILRLAQNDKREIPITILGGLANTIIRDGGIRGLTIQMDKQMAAVERLDDVYISAQAGALNGTVAAMAAKNGIGGLEFLSGIPGSVGGAVAMNAGAYGAEVKDVLVGIEALDRVGALHRFTAEDLNMTYRNGNIPAGMIVVKAIFKGKAEDKETVKARLSEIKEKRRSTQPITEKTGGSTFANPSAAECFAAGLPEGTRAWQVVDKVGGRGLTIGGAQMSEKHCNFMLNIGGATAKDLEMLGDELIRRARHDLGIDLHWEIKRIGEK